MSKKPHTLCIAPMMDCTDRHDRFLLRLISRYCFLYTEMVTTGALINGDSERFLAYDNSEHPLAFQLGGSDPTDMMTCAKMIEDHGYDEVNINAGCPSDRVQSGRFGACLMAEPELVAECVNEMSAKVSIPVTVKTRIGIDDRDAYSHLHEFIETVHQAGCDCFVIHARKAWLKGLSPKQNREIPPLKYETVFQLKKDFPQLEIIINGGIKTLQHSAELLQSTDGVMIGREAYHNPYSLAEADRVLYGDTASPRSRTEIVALYQEYIEQQVSLGTPIKAMTRHLIGLFHGQPGARAWRRHLSDVGPKPGTGIEVIQQALDQLPTIPSA